MQEESLTLLGLFMKIEKESVFELWLDVKVERYKDYKELPEIDDAVVHEADYDK